MPERNGLFGASKTVPREKRVFKVDISGDERNIAAAIDKYLNQIKDKYGNSGLVQRQICLHIINNLII